jgi:hypothetical protein
LVLLSWRDQVVDHVLASPPVLTKCPATDFLFAAAGKPTLNATTLISGIFGTTSCGSSVRSVYNIPVDALIPNQAPFSISATVQDTSSGLIANSNCSFKINIDYQFPVITCPSHQYVSPNTGFSSSVTVSNLVVTATDDVGIYWVSCGTHEGIRTSAGYAFPIGTTTVTCYAYDTSYNFKTCAFNVVNTDIIPPTITCPPNLVVTPTNFMTPTVALTSYNAVPTGSDLAGIKAGSASCVPTVSSSTPFTFTLGVRNVTWYVSVQGDLID